MGGPSGVVGGGYLPEQILVEQVVAPAEFGAGNIDSDAVDTKGIGCVIFTVGLGISSSGTPTLDGKIMECATVGGVYTDVVLASGAFGAVTAPQKTVADNSTSHRIIVDPRKTLQFLKYRGVLAGAATPKMLVQVQTVKGGFEQLPAA